MPLPPFTQTGLKLSQTGNPEVDALVESLFDPSSVLSSVDLPAQHVGSKALAAIAVALCQTPPHVLSLITSVNLHGTGVCGGGGRGREGAGGHSSH